MGAWTTAQLREQGLGKDTIRRRVRAGKLFRVHRGIYTDEWSPLAVAKDASWPRMSSPPPTVSTSTPDWFLYLFSRLFFPMGLLLSGPFGSADESEDKIDLKVLICLGSIFLMTWLMSLLLMSLRMSVMSSLL